MTPPKIIRIKSLLDQYRDEERLRKKRAEASANYQRREAAKEYGRRDDEPYGYERRTMTPLDFAKHVIRDQLSTHHGHLWLDGRYATPARIVEHADAKLVGMKLAPVGLGKRS